MRVNASDESAADSVKAPAKTGRFQKGNPHRFKPGQSGNPKGGPHKKPITALYERLLARPANVKELEALIWNILRGKSAMAKVLQLEKMAERVEGKVAQPLEVNGELALTLADRMKRAEERLKQ